MAAHILVESEKNLSNVYTNQTFVGFQPSPPDPIIAVGPTSFITMVNVTFGIYDKLTMKPIYVNSLASLWGVSFSRGDPYVVYDESSERFFLCAFGEVVFAPDTDILIAVSKDSNPQSPADFHLYKYRSPDLADYPKLAVDKEAVYITTQAFNTFNGNLIWAFDKSSILNGPNNFSLLPNYEARIPRDSFNSLPEFIFPLHPRPSLNGSDKVVFIQSKLDLAYPGPGYQGEHVRLMYFNNILESPTLVTADLRVPVYSGLSGKTIEQPPPTLTPADSQGNPVPLIGLESVMGVIFGVNVNGSVWATHSVFSEDGQERLVLRWYEIDIGDFVRENKPPVLKQCGNVDSGGSMNHFVPSINVDDKNNMAIHFTLAGPEQYPVIAYTGRLSADPPGTIRLPLQTAKGGDLYYQQGTPRNRWGDYSGLAIDPIDRTFWLFNEYPVAVPAWNYEEKSQFFVEVEGVGCFPAEASLRTQELRMNAPLCAPGIVRTPRNGSGPSQKTQVGSTLPLPMEELIEGTAVNGVCYEVSAGLKFTPERDPFRPNPVPSEPGEWFFVKKNTGLGDKVYAQCGQEDDPLLPDDVLSPVDDFKSAMFVRTTDPRQFAQFDLNLFWSTEPFSDYLRVFINELEIYSVSGKNKDDPTAYNTTSLPIELLPGQILKIEFSKDFAVKDGYDSIFFNIENLALFSSPVSGAIAIVTSNPDEVISSIFVENMAIDGALATLIISYTELNLDPFGGAPERIAVVVSEQDGLRILDGLSRLPTPPIIRIVPNYQSSWTATSFGSNWSTYVQAFTLTKCCCPNQRKNYPDDGGVPSIKSKSIPTPVMTLKNPGMPTTQHQSKASLILPKPLPTKPLIESTPTKSPQPTTLPLRESTQKPTKPLLIKSTPIQPTTRPLTKYTTSLVDLPCLVDKKKVIS
jgi:hypothetical protein